MFDIRLRIIRLHRKHEMRTIATDGPVTWCVCQFVCNSLGPAKAAAQIEVLFEVATHGAQGTL